MVYEFLSDEWITACKNALNDSEEFAREGADWHEGPIVLVLPREPMFGIDEDWLGWLDLDGGKCRDIKQVTHNEAKEAPFVITTNFTHWKQVFKKELDPIKGMMQGKLKLKGSLPTIVRQVSAAQAMVNSISQVPTKFPDE